MRTRISLAAVPAVALVALLAAPAHAEYYSIDDPVDARPSLSDVTSMTARHGQENVKVKVRFKELVRSSAAGLSVFFDTDRGSRGPEYVLSSGLGDGTDYVLTRADGWRGTGNPVRCDYSARPRWGKEVFRTVVSRDCFDRVGKVRVSVKMVDPTDGSRRVVDWVPQRRRWSLSIGSGLDA